MNYINRDEITNDIMDVIRSYLNYDPEDEVNEVDIVRKNMNYATFDDLLYTEIHNKVRTIVRKIINDNE